MGSGASIPGNRLSCEDVANFVAHIGPDYAQFAVKIRENGIDGAFLEECSHEEVDDLLKEIGVTKLIPRKKLMTELKKINSKNGGASDEKDEKKEEVASQSAATLPPAVTLGNLFKIQGIKVDPQELSSAVDKLVARLNNIKLSEGKTFHCFLSYRVRTDADLVEKLYYALKAAGLNPFMDKYCLVDGQGWKEGFIDGLQRSETFVAVVSSDGLAPLRDITIDHSGDNVLLEYEIALKINAAQIQAGHHDFVIPLLVGRYIDGALHKFDKFDTSLYASDIKAATEGSITIPHHGGAYKGEIHEGKAHGIGTCTWDTEQRKGNSYTGEFRENYRNGKGKYTWAEGRVYEGECKDDKWHGKGKFFTGASGNVYEGEWKDSKYNGKGKMTHKGGKIEDGEWKEGKFLG